MVYCDTLLEVTLSHLRKVVLKTLVVSKQDCGALHLAVGWRIFLVLVHLREVAECIKFVKVAQVSLLLSATPNERTRKLLCIGVYLSYIHSGCSITDECIDFNRSAKERLGCSRYW